MSLTFSLLSFFHRAAIHPKTLEPRWGVFIFLYYGIGIFAAVIVAAMLLLCLEAFDLVFARDFLYRQLGEPLLTALEALLF